MKNIFRVYKALSDETVWDGNIDWLHNTSVVIEHINKTYKTDATRLNYFKSIVSILKRLKGYEDLSKIYSKEMTQLKIKVDEKAGSNKLTQREEKNFVQWSELASLDQFDTDEDRLLHALYTAIPPRRHDYKYLKLVKIKQQKKKQTLDKNFNWLVLNKQGNPIEIIINNYKTKKRYGTFTIDLRQSDQLPIFNFSKIRNIIKKFVSSSGINSGELVFPTTDGKVYTTFSRRIEYVFRSTGKNVSSNILRHSFITHYSNKNISLNTIKLLAKYLGHSPTEFLSYRKLNAEELMSRIKEEE